jgi:hypothetical protein
MAPKEDKQETSLSKVDLLLERSGRHEAQIETLVQGQRDIWTAINDMRKPLNEIAVSTACLPTLVKEYGLRLDELETAETLRKGEARQRRKWGARIAVIAGVIGAAIGPLIEWIKSFTGIGGRVMKWFLMFVCIVVACVGCAPIEGTTVADGRATITVRPLSGEVAMSSSRDDHIALQSLTADIPEKAPGPLAGTKLEVKGLDLDASASKVRKANANQIAAMGQFNQDTGQAWGTVVDAFGNSIVSPVMGRLYPNTGAETARTFTTFGMLALVLVLVVVFVKLWTWLFPAKDPTKELLLAAMLQQRAKA